MPREERITVSAAFQQRHPRLYTALYQLVLAVLTFYCAVAISRYTSGHGEVDEPEPAPGTTADEMKWRWFCEGRGGVNEDAVDINAVLFAITPRMVLCPRKLLFYAYMLSFISGTLKFNSLNPEGVGFSQGYTFFIFAGVLVLGWRQPWLDFCASTPLVVWAATVLNPVAHGILKRIAPEVYERYKRVGKIELAALWDSITPATSGDEEAVEVGERGEAGDTGEDGEGEGEREVEVEGIADEEMALTRNDQGTRGGG